MDIVKLKKNSDRRIKSGHLWIFNNEIHSISSDIENGAIVEVINYDTCKIGYGFFNKNSLIAVRLLKDFPGNIDKYFEDKIQKAFELRNTFYPNRSSYRLVFSESDYLPGLIIDKYNDTFVLQIYSAGIEKNINSIVNILIENYNAKNIFTANEPYFRTLEGIEPDDKIYHGNKGYELIDDGHLKYEIDFSESQKTGFYFDQCDNREFIRKLSNGKMTADIFCNSGGFGMHSASAGATFITFVDSSESALETAKKNYSSNELTVKSEFIKSDAFDFLQKCIDDKRRFDLIILDPPAFAKSKKHLPTAIKGYTKLNRLALNCLRSGDFLVTSSCSFHIKKEDFMNCLNKAASQAERNIQLIHFNNASLDHPQLPSMDETNYLKFAVFRVA